MSSNFDACVVKCFFPKTKILDFSKFIFVISDDMMNDDTIELKNVGITRLLLLAAASVLNCPRFRGFL